MSVRSVPLSWQSTLGALFLAVVFTATLGATGVERRLTIHTNPPGALVKVDDNEIGISPVSVSFIYYGTRKIQLIKPGFETLTILQPIRTPWYQYPGLDFFSEHVIPGQRRDLRVLTYHLQPQVMVPTEQLLERAEALRRNGQGAAVAPVSSPLPVPAGDPLPVARSSGTHPPLAPSNQGPFFLPPGPAVPRPLPPAEQLPATSTSRLPF
ncbi:MAG: PEGA domain-containing protein [Planctomycetales bacterium]|nr:PEGA domain-containing protein [Planctomycetales bacterium]NIM07604.1 PEGA domain-containing protein [Planctomycetales bacterium]NIN07110.1 PEGA domain-containing protein [Planctomycetales bacterium]NIN76204.1 PEGA domain-containing protein [Planctomycetales bacterium]NIO33426.1 PEGA domain-containing protein [Planctomycetales bacterium]